MTTATCTRKFYLTHRDVRMLESINVGRFMTAEGLEWLHFPTWRDRWAAAQAAGMTESYRPAPHLYRRLNHLIDHGYVYRMRRPIERSREIFGRAPDVYMLSAWIWPEHMILLAYSSPALFSPHPTHEMHKRCAARGRARCFRKPCPNPHHIESRCADQMLEMDLGMPNVPGVAQITAAIPLIEHALDTGPLTHLLLELVTLLPFTGRL